MIKFLEKNKFFMVIILALISLALGMFFVEKPNNSTDKVNVNADTYTVSFSLWILWSYDTGSRPSYGQYKSADGNYYNGEPVTVETTLYYTGGGSWDVFSTFTCKTSDLIKKATYTVSDSSWAEKNATSFSCGYNGLTITVQPGFNATSSSHTNLVELASGKVWAFGGEGESESDITVFFYPNKYDVTYNAGDGKFSDGNSTKTMQDIKYYDNYDFPSETPTRPGYTFANWLRVKGITEDVIYHDSVVIMDEPSNHTLEAEWSANKYTITFDMQGGSGYYATKSIEATYDEDCPEIYVPNKTGYSFCGYYEKPNGEGKQYYDSWGEAVWHYDVAGDTTLYAYWQAKYYDVTIEPNGGTISNLNGWTNTSSIYKKIQYMTNYGTLPELLKTGYTFDNYTYDGNVITSSTTMIWPRAHTLTANWREHTYRIEFDSGGGIGTMYAIENVLYSQKVSLSPNTFTKPGYFFKGWSLTNGGELKYYEEDYVYSLTSVDNGVVTLYAVWEDTWANYAEAPLGQGSEDNPYLISSAGNLAWMASQTENRTSLSGHFKQTAHINLNGKTWKPIGNYDYKFLGSYNGSGYAITNLNIPLLADEYKSIYDDIGLFGYTYSATIKNVNILAGEINGYFNVGGIVGNALETMIENCQTDLTIVGLQRSGGLIGSAENSTILNSYSESLIDAGYSGGIVGQMIRNVIIDNCGFYGRFIEGKSQCYIIATRPYKDYSNLTVKNCFGKTTCDVVLCSTGITIENCIWENANGKYYSGTDFSNWVISTTDMPLPKGLSWIAKVADTMANENKIKELGYIAA